MNIDTELVSMDFGDGDVSEGGAIPQVEDVLRASDLTAMGSHIYNIPTRLSELELVDGQNSCIKLGSNIGGLFKNQEGEKYYVKVPLEDDHARVEVLATNLYSLTNIQALENNLIEIDVIPKECYGLWAPMTYHVVKMKKRVTGIVTKWIEDIEDIEVAEMKAVPDVRRGLAMDAWIGHYDNVGNYNEHNDNPVKALNMKRRHGRAFRIDFGGVFDYKAKGCKKSPCSQYDIVFTDESVPEWKAYQEKLHPFMWDNDVEKQHLQHRVFGGMTRAERIESLRVVTDLSANDVRAAVTRAFPDQVHQVRRDELIRMLLNRQRLLRKYLDLDLLCSINTILLHGKKTTDEELSIGKTKQAQMWNTLKEHGWLGKKMNKKNPEPMQDTLNRHGVDMEGEIAAAVQKRITESPLQKMSIKDLQTKYCPKEKN